MSLPSFPFSEQELSCLENVLFDAELEEESPDLFGIHGMLCAFTICPESVPVSAWLEHIVGDGSKLSDERLQLVNGLIQALAQHIAEQLRRGQEIQLPEEIFNNETALSNWCVGFVEGFMVHENAWFEGQDEPTIAALMLPVMTHSGLFVDDFFRELHKQDESMAKMLNDIPGNLLDLYLLYQT